MLQRLAATGVLAPLDVHFSLAMDELSAGEEPSVLLAAALVSRAVRHGHVCLDLRRTLATPLIDAEGRPVPLPVPGNSPHRWALELSSSKLVSAGERATPLVFDGGARLYLSRYFHYQRALAERLVARVHARPEDIDTERLSEGVARLLPDRDDGTGFVAHAQQRLAAAVAVLRGLTVISGGPGTGKTTTVLRILALLQEQAIGAGRDPLRIRLLAPTGKAAARLVESIEAGRAALPCAPEIRDAIPTEASTIHRALGFRPGAPTQFRHCSDDPLPADVVLVDEASMVDLALMSKLLDAVPDRARVILLGDKNQLASVEAGAILGDICNAGNAHGYSQAFADEIGARVGAAHAPPATGPATPGIWDCIVELTHSFRFEAEGGIGGLARAIGSGDGPAVLRALGEPVSAEAAYHPGAPEVAWVRLRDGDDPGVGLRPGVLAGLSPMLRHDDPSQRLRALSAFRVLAAHRKGRFGIEHLTLAIEDTLEAAGLIRRGDPFYDGRPVLVTKNDYQLDLFNGDVGIIGRDVHGRARTVFARPDGSERVLSPHRLPPHETVFAMTVHKSQGSEFDRVAVVVPPAVSPILTRELIYTAVTRAKSRVVLHGEASVIAEATTRRIDRASGLREALWGAQA
ncbi:MAG: exodeoxyribonuclease V subunit alpha [Myxococcota bacterium]